MEAGHERDARLLHHITRELRELDEGDLTRLGLTPSRLDALRATARTALDDMQPQGHPIAPAIPPDTAALLPRAINHLADHLGDQEIGLRTPYTTADFRDFAERISQPAPPVEHPGR